MKSIYLLLCLQNFFFQGLYLCNHLTDNLCVTYIIINTNARWHSLERILNIHSIISISFRFLRSPINSHLIYQSFKFFFVLKTESLESRGQSPKLILGRCNFTWNISRNLFVFLKTCVDLSNKLSQYFIVLYPLLFVWFSHHSI